MTFRLHHLADIPVEDRLKKIFVIFVLIHIVFTVPSWLGIEDVILSWLVTLLAYALRLCLWAMIPILFFPKEKIFWFMLIMCLLNIPTILSDLLYIDKYDNIWLYLKVVLALSIIFLSIKQLRSNK